MICLEMYPKQVFEPSRGFSSKTTPLFRNPGSKACRLHVSQRAERDVRRYCGNVRLRALGVHALTRPETRGAVGEIDLADAAVAAGGGEKCAFFPEQEPWFKRMGNSW